MKRRWFLGRLVVGGLVLPVVSAGFEGCGVDRASSTREDDSVEETLAVVGDRKKLVVATSANYPPYEKLEAGTGAEAGAKSGQMVGFDIDLAQLIAKRLGRKLTMVDLEFDELIPTLEDDQADMAIAALEPTPRRKQRVDFSNVYYRAQQALVSLDGYLDARDLGYQTIGVRASSGQARFAERLSEDYPNIDVIPYDTLDELFKALDIGAVEAAILEANIAETHLKDYPNFGLKMVQDDRTEGSAIAFPKNSSLRQHINDALSEIESSGEMSRLIDKWFS